MLATEDDDFEVIVVDQSVAPVTDEQSGALIVDKRVRWITSPTTGLSTSRNIAPAAARAPVIAFTDDDCRVEPGWVASIRHAFQADLEMAMMFGTVILLAEDRADGYAAEFEPGPRAEYRGCFPDIRKPWGIGANMALRHTVADLVGSFDEMLGAGAPFHAGEEIDFTIRVLQQGVQGRLQRRDLRVSPGSATGVGCATAHPQLRRRYGCRGRQARQAPHAGAPGLWAGLVWHHSRRSANNALHRHSNPGFGLVVAIVVGTARSLTRRLDRSMEEFR